MENFEFKNCTKIIFGKGSEKKVGNEVKKYGNKVLLLYWGGSIKKYGIYDKVISSLNEAGLQVTELGGVRSNPTLDKVREGVKICKQENIDIVLAVGGGSVIDTAKGIAVGTPHSGDVWEFAEKKATPQKALPIGVVLTIPAAGSESSQYAVITNTEGEYPLKRDLVWENNALIRPKFAILNPEFSYSLSPYQTACGVIDIMAHVMERYFTKVKHVELTDRMCEAVMKTAINNGRIIANEPKNYDARAEIMWAGSLAHNDLLDTGRGGDWASHFIGMELSAVYDVAHGASLSLIFPAWMKYVYKFSSNKLIQFATRVWNVDYDFYKPERTVLEGIRRYEAFCKELGLPIRLSEVDIGDEKFEEMAKNMIPTGDLKEIQTEDALEILKLAK
ncbi:MAG: iron-containing alcohol dehydrogenase [Candidatus Humimicrobiaceae bacterium]